MRTSRLLFWVWFSPYRAHVGTTIHLLHRSVCRLSLHSQIRDGGHSLISTLERKKARFMSLTQLPQVEVNLWSSAKDGFELYRYLGGDDIMLKSWARGWAFASVSKYGRWKLLPWQMCISYDHFVLFKKWGTLVRSTETNVTELCRIPAKNV